MPSQLFIWVQAVVHLLLPWFRVTPLVQSSFLTKYELCCCIFKLHISGWSSDIFIFYWMNSEILNFMHYIGESLGGLYVILWCNYLCPTGTFSTQRLQPILWKCGRWCWPRYYNWGDPSWVDSISSFFSSVVRKVVYFGFANETVFGFALDRVAMVQWRYFHCLQLTD